MKVKEFITTEEFKAIIQEETEKALEIIKELERLQAMAEGGCFGAYTKARKIVKGLFSDMGGKMEGINAIGTSPLINPHCLKRMQDPNSICYYCYSVALQGMRKTVMRKCIRNAVILSRYVIPLQFLPIFQLGDCLRFEPWGDLINLKHIQNFMNMCTVSPEAKCTLWTKNDWILNMWSTGNPNKADKSKYPDNLKVVGSAYYVDVPENIKDRPACHMVFNTFSSREVCESMGRVSNCQGINCLTCKHSCYSSDDLSDRNEILKGAKFKGGVQ